MSETIFPREANSKQGWVLNYAFLESVKKDIYEYDHCPDLESIELVLLSAPVGKIIKSLESKIAQDAVKIGEMEENIKHEISNREQLFIKYCSQRDYLEDLEQKLSDALACQSEMQGRLQEGSDDHFYTLKRLSDSNKKLALAVEALEFYGNMMSYTLDDYNGISGEMRSRVVLYGDSVEINDVSSHAGRRAIEALKQIKGGV